MNVWHYLNSKRGTTLVATYGAMLTIITVNVLLVVMCFRSEWSDIPTGAGGVVVLIIGLITSAAVVDRKLTPEAPTKEEPPL